MVSEQTLSIIKPDAVSKNLIGEILARFEQSGLKVVASKMLQMSKAQGQEFYLVHRERPFYEDLTEFISSGPIVVCVLEGEDAIMKNRDIMGATDPKDAASGTIRSDFAESINRNAVHGSDSPDTARVEIDFFFKPDEIYNR